MYELEYVKRRKKKKRAIIFGSLGTIGIATFSIIAFLGRYVGTFTVSLEAKDVDLTLSTSSSFKETSSYLSVQKVPPFQEYTYQYFDDVGGMNALDDENNDVMFGANPNNESLNFFKYTFFVKNVGITPAKYNISLKIIDNVAASDGRTLDDTLRVLVLDNGKDSVYAKGSLSSRAPISITESEASEAGVVFPGYAKNFSSSTEVMHKNDVPLLAGQFRKYTVVIWLEGARSSNTQSAPKGATIKLGVEINAYEKQ